MVVMPEGGISVTSHKSQVTSHSSLPSNFSYNHAKKQEQQKGEEIVFRHTTTPLPERMGQANRYRVT